MAPSKPTSHLAATTTPPPAPLPAVLVYRTLKDHLIYADPGADAYDAQNRTRVVRRLRQRAEHLGFGLVSLSTGEVVEGSVS
jgi:hypothetical protein